jgi:hypothetical protein
LNRCIKEVEGGEPMRDKERRMLEKKKLFREWLKAS